MKIRAPLAVTLALVFAGLIGVRLHRPASLAPPQLASGNAAVGPEAWSGSRPAAASGREERRIEAAAWAPPGDVAAFDRFRRWTERFIAASDPAARRGLRSEGVTLARDRRAVLKGLIRSDPRRALELAVPVVLYAQLPEEVVALLEQRVSDVGRLDVRHVDWQEGGRLRGEVFRTATIGDVQYHAYVFGRRLTQVPLPRAYLSGVALDQDLALCESPVRVLERGEDASQAISVAASNSFPATTEDPVVAQIGNTVVRFATKAALQAAEERLYLIESLRTPLAEMSLAALLDPEQTGLTLASETDRSLGPKRVIVLRVNFPDLPGEPANFDGTVCTPAYLQAVNTGEIAPFYAQCSFGRTSLEFTLAPTIYRVAQNTSVYAQNAQTTGSDALQQDVYAAVGNDYDLNAFDHVIMVFSMLPGYPGGMAGGHDLWISGSYRFSVVAHELGHNYGWAHANLWVGGSNPIDYAGGFSWEYADSFDVMGWGTFPDSFGFSVPTMATWGWLTAGQTATAIADDTYRIYASDQNGLSPAGTQLLGVKLRQNETHDYWVSFRSPHDAASGGYPAGAHIIRMGAGYRQTDLIPLNNLSGAPYSSIQRSEMVVPVGSAFSDPGAGLSIQVLAHGGTGRDQYIDVKVSFSPTPVRPEVGLEPANQLGVRSGASALFSTWARAGQPQAAHRWQRQPGGTGAWIDLVDDGSYSGSGTPSLVIQATTAGMDQDLYRCRLENPAGSAVTTAARLTVIEVTSGRFTLAGRLGMSGYTDGPAAVAQFGFPMGLALAADGSLYVCDARNNRIRRVAPNGTVSTVPLGVTSPRSACLDAAGNLYVTDEVAAVIWCYSPAGITSVYAGQLWTPGSNDGDRSTARLRAPNGLAIDTAGNLYVSDVLDHTVRRITTAGVVSTLAGTPGVAGYLDGPGATARFTFWSGGACGVAVGPDDAVYVADQGNHCIRRIGTDGTVTTVAGSPDRAGSADGPPPLGSLDVPVGVAVDVSGVIYVADNWGNTIRAISPDGTLYTIGGSGGSTEGVGPAFGLMSPQAVLIGLDNRLYIADANNSAIRVYLPTAPLLTREPVDAPATGVGGRALFAVDVTGASPLPEFQWQQRAASPAGGAWTNLAEGNSFLGSASARLSVIGVSSRLDGDEFRCVITNAKGTVTSRAASLSIATNGVFTLAGAPATAAMRDSIANDAGVGSPRGFSLATDGSLAFIDGTSTLRTLAPSGLAGRPTLISTVNASGLASDAAGFVYFTDQYQHAVKKLRADGSTELIAGADSYSGSGWVDGAAITARFNYPTQIARASSGVLYVYDSGNHVVRAISPAGQVTTVAGLAGFTGVVDGTGSAARFTAVTAMCVAADGNLTVRDYDGRLVRRVTPGGVVTTLAGSAAYGSADGQGAAAVIGTDDGGMAVGPDGTIYLAERATGKIRTVSATGFVGTLRDEGGAPVIFSQPGGIAADATGVLYVGELGRHTISGYLRPPRIIQGPENVTAAPGATVTLAVDATGTVGATYQWSRNGVALAGATGSALTLTNLSVLAAGNYTVEVSNRGGYRTSAPASVSVAQSQSIIFAAPADQPFSFMPLALSATASSGLDVSYTIVAGPARLTGSSLAFSGTGAVTVRATQAGDATYAAATPVEHTFTVTPNFASWQAQYFSAAEISDAVATAPSAVYAQDDLPNLVKYALGLDPTINAPASRLPQVSTDAADWLYTFTRPSGQTDLTVTVEVSSDLVNWTTTNVTLNLVVTAGAIDTYTAKYPLSASANAFFRLKVTRP